jgi:hypothetical protein
MNLDDFRIFLEGIRDQILDSVHPEERIILRFEAFQQYLISQDPADLPTSLQLLITASPQLGSEKPYCDKEDFAVFGGWESFFVQSNVLQLFTAHNCDNCKSPSLQGCLICLTWIAFSDLDLSIENQTVQMHSSRFNGFSTAVEGSAGPNGVSLTFQSTTQEPIGCSVKT